MCYNIYSLLKTPLELRIIRNNNVGIKKWGDNIEEMCWIYKENKNNTLSGKDYAIGRKDSKIMNGLSYQSYGLVRYWMYKYNIIYKYIIILYVF